MNDSSKARPIKSEHGTDTSYPHLTMVADDYGSCESQSWRAAVVRFAALQVPLSLSCRSERLRSLPFWKLFAGYFPAELHKTHDLPAMRKYVFGYHPDAIISHGVISHGAF